MEDLIFENPPIKTEYERWMKKVGEKDIYATESTIGIHEVLRAHFLVCDYFYSKNDGLGGVGPKSLDLLHSAVYRQFISFGGKDKWTNEYQKVATLAYGIICNHPFHDANKRTGILIILLFLEKRKRSFTIRHREIEDMAIDIADHKLNKYRRFQQLQKNTTDPEVYFITDYLRKNTRSPESGYKSITYQQLNRRLQDFGYRFGNPHNNFIDVVRTKQKSTLFGFGKKESIDVKVCQVGFPGWKSQVGKGAIATIRREAKLRTQDGFDSGCFFNGLDPIPPLIDRYAGLLERLSHK